jgi:uncharacterized protein YjiS (DUF1127 family)
MTIIDDLISLTKAQYTPRPFQHFQRRARWLINSVVAAAIAYRQRQANLTSLRHLGNRELKDIGLYRSQIEYGLQEAAQERSQRQIETAIAGGQRGTSHR